MTKTNLKTILSFASLLCCFFLSKVALGQGPLPFEIKNNSPFPDSELYVAIVGIDYTNNAHIWVNPKNSKVLPMDKSYNTIKGPSYNGNMGPGTNSMYANCFVKLSEIPNKTFLLPPIAGCRVFISKGQPLYFYFFGSTGTTVGYTSPNHLDVNDPNKDIMYEIVELTYNQYGFFGNTSRVDAYKYPMGLELYGAGGFSKKVGELKSHQEILNLYKANVPTEFQGTVNEEGEIWAPSKTSKFQDGTNGTTPGAYGNYLKSYIDAIWEKYKNVDLIFNAGEAAVFKGRVIAEQLQVKEVSGRFEGKTGTVVRRPTTQEALEGKGVLDHGLSESTRTVDLVVQAQLTAAINRHMVDVTSPNPGQQNWHDKSRFYKAEPMNHFSKFWHLPGISIDGLSYGFAYDDVADHSPSLHTGAPTKVVAVFGGYAGSNPDPDPEPSAGPVTLYSNCEYDGTAIALEEGEYTLSQLSEIGIADNDIASIKVGSGYKVELFDEDNFGGVSTLLNASSACLSNLNWADKVTSVKISTWGATNLGGIYTFKNRKSGLAMELAGCSAADGSNIYQSTPTGSTCQQFRLTHIGNGLYRILVVQTGKSIEIAAESIADEANVQQGTYLTKPYQQFVIQSTGDGYYKLIAKHSAKVIEVENGSLARGGNVHQFTDNNQIWAQWKFTQVSVTNLNGIYSLVNRKSKLVMEVRGASTVNGASIIQNSATGAANQQFKFTHLRNGLYNVVSLNSGKAIEISSANSGDGAKVGQWTLNAAATNQQFYVRSTGDGYFKLVAKHSNRLIDVPNGATGALVALQQWADDGQKSGQWKIAPLGTLYSATIQAESFNSMSGVVTEVTTDANAGLNVTGVESGDWMVYNNINVPESATYTVEYRVASTVSGGRLSLDINSGTTVLGSVEVPSTGGEQVWTTASHTIALKAGAYSFGIFAQQGGWKINWWRITKLNSSRNVISSEIELPLSVFPVPSGQRININSIDDLSGAAVKIMDEAGKEIIISVYSTDGFDVSELKPGVYTISITSHKKSQVLRFIKE